MDYWIGLWTAVLVLGLGIFIGLAVVVTVGGFRDIRALFRRIEQQHADAGEDPPRPPDAS